MTAPQFTLTFLGTGTSTGVPQMRCGCATCSSTDPRDKRLRASAIVTDTEGHNLLIDCGPDLRQQVLRAGNPDLCAVVVTHTHYDHVGGIDDLRPYCHDFADSHFPVYCRADVARDLRARVPYCFVENPYPGVPVFDICEIRENVPFTIPGTSFGPILPLPVMHARLPILGFRIGPLAYITDCKTLPAESLDALCGVDTLVINALRPWEHMSHLSLPDALEIIAKVRPRQAYLTHISHDMPPHATVSLPDNVHLAYDGLTIKIPLK